MYKGYEKLEQIINMAAVDQMFDLGETQSELDSHTYLSRIIMQY